MPFSGETLELIPGALGLAGKPTNNPSHLLLGDNIALNKIGQLRKEGGSIKYNATPITGAPAILGGWDWWPTNTTQRMVVLGSDGKLYKDNGAGTFATELKSGLTITDVVPIFVDGGQEAAAEPKKLFIFTGLNAVQVLAADGATTADIVEPAADWATKQPICGAVHENRLWAASRHFVYYSDPDDHEMFVTGGGQMPVFPGVGDEIAGLLSFKGALLVFKRPVGIFLIDTSSADVAAWRVERISKNVGIASPLGFSQVIDDVLFQSRSGSVHILSAVQEFGDVSSSSVTAQQNLDDYIKDNFNKGNFPFAHMVYYDDKGEVHITAASVNASASDRDRRLVVDLNMPGTPRFRTSSKDTNRSLWLRRDSNGVGKMVSGDNSGTVWLLDDPSLAKAGMGYVGTFETPPLDFSSLNPKLGTMNKIGKFLEVVAQPEGNWTLNVEVYWDDVFKQTIQYNLASGGAQLGSFVLDTDTLAASKSVRKRRRLVGSGRTLTLVGKNSSAGQGFAIDKLYVHFKPGGEGDTQE